MIQRGKMKKHRRCRWQKDNGGYPSRPGFTGSHGVWRESAGHACREWRISYSSEGDRVGIWSVVSIGEKTVQLSSAAGNLFLELP
ncbi:MAG: hypothetical protein ACLUIQ_08625 [Dialister invisus]